MEVLNYTSPLLIATYYLASNIWASCYLRHDVSKRLSKRRNALLIGLHFITVACYITQSLSYLPSLTSTPDDFLIFALSQTLLWTCLSLLRYNTTNPVPSIHTATPALNLVLETAICILAFFPPDETFTEQNYGPQAVRILTLVILALLSIMSALPSSETETAINNSETQSLIGHAADSSTVSASPTLRYDTLNSQEAGSEPDQWTSGSDSDSDSDSDEDEDDKEMQKIQQQRLQDTGGWIGYLKAFKVFLPHIYPKGNPRLQSYLVLMLVNTVAQRALRVLHPRQLGIIIDVLTKEKRIPWKDIFLWIAFEIAASDFGGLGALSEMLKNRVSAWSSQRLGIASLNHVMGLSMDFHDSKDSGEIIKAIEQAKSINSVVETFVLDILPGAIDMLIAMCYVTVLLDAYALLVVVAVAMTFVFATSYLSIFASSARRLNSRKDREQSKIIYESVSNWFAITCLNRKTYTMSRLSQVVRETANAALRTDDLYTFMFIAQEQAEIFGRLGITILAAHRVVTGLSSIGDLVTVESYWGNLMQPLYVLGHSYRELNTHLIDSERLLQLFQQQSTIKDSANARIVTDIDGEVRFDQVEFGYPGRKPALRDFNMTVQPGQMIALVGETGSGKSTILKLLMRFYDVTGGAITIDGHDIRNISLDSLRESFGFVPQDSVLFNMSILDNVRYGNVNATEEEVFEACRAACIHDKILTFPNGYASKVGERGVKLSGGERQRIAIARVFLKNPQIVLLDEATSAMDSQTEAKIQTALKNLIQGRTTFVIAHRLSTVVEADRILVIDEGRVVESGSHYDLLQTRGRYYDLWTKQSSVVSS